MRALLLAGAAVLALSAAPAFAQTIIATHNSVPIAYDDAQAATNGGVNANESGNFSDNTSNSGNGNHTTVGSDNTDILTAVTPGNDSATALAGGLAVVSDHNLNETTTELATSVVTGTVEHNSAGYAPGSVRDGLNNSISQSLGGQGVLVVQQNVAPGALQQNSISLSSVVGAGASGSGVGSGNR